MVKNVQQAHNKSNDICPHVDDNDARCGHRFSLGRINQAFDVCFGSFHGCPMFHRLNGEVSLRDGQEGRSYHVNEPATPEFPEFPESPKIPITTEGETIELRPTGT